MSRSGASQSQSSSESNELDFLSFFYTCAQKIRVRRFMAPCEWGTQLEFLLECKTWQRISEKAGALTLVNSPACRPGATKQSSAVGRRRFERVC